METVCHKQLRFESLSSKEVIADFEGGRITSDAGGLLLRELDQRYRLAENAARCLHDPREGHKVKHDFLTLVRQRLFAIAQGYEDNNGAGDLASQPTLSRFENRVNAKDLRRLSDGLLELYLKTHPGPRKTIILDMDATDDPTHGKQQLSFFHGYYEEHMYHPLLVFDGRDGFPLAAVLRPGNTHASKGALAVLKRLIKKLKKAYPGALILFRADAGFAIPAIYRYLEKQPDLRYVIGFTTNNRLLAKTGSLLARAQQRYQETGAKQRLFTSFSYQAESWDQPRRIIAKVEYTHLGANQRFVVTNLVRNPQFVYDEIYVLRGDVENRIKELKLELKADRLSCHRFLANQFRLAPPHRRLLPVLVAAPPPPGHGIGHGPGQHPTPQALEDRGPHPGDQPPHLGPPGLRISLPRAAGRAVAKSAVQSRLNPTLLLFHRQPGERYAQTQP